MKQSPTRGGDTNRRLNTCQPVIRTFYLLFFSLATQGLFPPDSVRAQNPEFTTWSTYNGDPTGAHYSALNQITRENVGHLERLWDFTVDDARRRSTIETNPLFDGNNLFVASPGLKIHALDPLTGKQKWVFDPFGGKGGGGVCRGFAYWAPGPRLLFVAGSYLHSINPTTGELDSQFGQNGRIDLHQGLDRDVFFLPVSSSSPGVVFEDLIILGSKVGEGPNPAAPGHVRAFDVRTGERRWIFHTIPHPGEFGYNSWPPNAWKTVGGANCWGGLTLDQERGWVFFGTGSPSYDHYGGNRSGQNLFANCVVALNARTGERQWHYQTVHHDLWDYDLPCAPNLVRVKRGERLVDAVAQPTKTGHVFVLDRETGEPLFPVEERPVPRSTIPGESSWPTQPFPLLPPPLAQQRLTENEATRLNQAARRSVLDRLREMRTGDIFLPPGLKPSVVLPQFNGGSEWGGAAYDPISRTLYLNTSSEAEWISMKPAKPPGAMSSFQLGRRTYQAVCSACHGFEHTELESAPSFASLKNVSEKMTPEAVESLLETGRGQMPSFAGLSVLEKSAVIDFLFGTGTDLQVTVKDLQNGWWNEIPFVSTGHHDFRDPDGYPANKRPWGSLTAIDLDTGAFRWQIPLGTYPALEKEGKGATGTFNMGGPMRTAGGLLFIGATMDERFRAFDAGSGTLLWSHQLEAGAYATPATFEVGGRQIVVVAAGGGGKPGTRSGNKYVAFALPED